MAEPTPQFPFETLHLSHGIEVEGHHNQGAQPFLGRDKDGAEENMVQASPEGMLSPWDFKRQQSSHTILEAQPKGLTSNSYCSDFQSRSGGWLFQAWFCSLPLHPLSPSRTFQSIFYFARVNQYRFLLLTPRVSSLMHLRSSFFQELPSPSIRIA